MVIVLKIIKYLDKKFFNNIKYLLNKVRFEDKTYDDNFIFSSFRFNFFLSRRKRQKSAKTATAVQYNFITCTSMRI